MKQPGPDRSEGQALYSSRLSKTGSEHLAVETPRNICSYSPSSEDSQHHVATQVLDSGITGFGVAESESRAAVLAEINWQHCYHLFSIRFFLAAPWCPHVASQLPSKKASMPLCRRACRLAILGPKCKWVLGSKMVYLHWPLGHYAMMFWYLDPLR